MRAIRILAILSLFVVPTTQAQPADHAAQRASVLALTLNVRPVFSGEQLPGVGMATAPEVEAAVGPHTYRVTYVNNDYQEVTTADAPGRYAAVVTVTPENSPPITRTVTLFRTAQPVNRRDLVELQGVTLPDGYGFPAETIEQHQGTINDAARRQVTRWLMYDPQGAELLAALYHAPQLGEGDDPRQTRHSVTTAADAWTFGLHKHLGIVEHRYLTHLPVGYDDPANADKLWPLVVFLHGAGERGHELEKVAYNGPPKHAENGQKFPFVLVSPQCDAGSWWSVAQVNDLVTEAMHAFRIDPDRVYLTGLSMGGYGSWATAAAHPDRFAAVAPVCGGGNPADGPVLAKLPIWAFHGDADTVVPLSQSTAMADAITAVDDSLFKLTVYEGVGHNSWDNAYEDARLYEWMLSNERGEVIAPPR